MKKDVMDRYRAFVEGYNGGVSRADLCATYRIPDEKFDAFLIFLRRKGFQLATRPAADAEFEQAHEIDFQIFGDDMQFVEVELDPGETAIAEAGAMMYMTSEIMMQTIFGSGGAENESVMAKIFGAGKRVLTGESLFLTAFTNMGGGKQRVAFAPSHPGKILAMNLGEMGGELICQKDSFLCAAKGVEIGIAFQKSLGTGLFGGEGFILQRLTGDGETFIHAGGMIVERTLGRGESLKLDTGCLVAMEPSVGYDIQFVGSIRSALFGGEGLFFATLTGPGRVWLQSLPFARLAARLGAGRQSKENSGVSIKLGG